MNKVSEKVDHEDSVYSQTCAIIRNSDPNGLLGKLKLNSSPHGERSLNDSDVDSNSR
jgi:hypothetical protein